MKSEHSELSIASYLISVVKSSYSKISLNKIEYHFIILCKCVPVGKSNTLEHVKNMYLNMPLYIPLKSNPNVWPYLILCHGGNHDIW